MKNMWKVGGATLLAGIASLIGSSPALAGALNTTFSATFNTGSLVGQSGLTLEFVLLDGSGLGDDNTTLTLTGFSFGTGSGPSSASLQDTSFFNFVTAPFVPGNQLSFTVGIASTNPDQPTPDSFEFVILNTAGSPILTTDPSGLDSLIFSDLTNPLSPQVYSVSPVPEPTSLVLFGPGLLILRFARLRWTHRRREKT